MPKGLSIREFARRDGCSDKIVRRKLQSGHLIAFDDGSIDPNLVGTDWRQRVRTPGADTPADSADTPPMSAEVSAPVRTADFALLADVADRILSGEGGEADEQLLTKAEAERLKENYAARLKRLEYDRESGAVVEIEDQILAVAAEYALIKGRLMSVGAKLAPRLSVMKSAEEIKALIDREIILILKELTLDAGGREVTAA